MINHFNYNLIQFSNHHKNISVIEHINLTQPSGTLNSAFGRHTQDGNPKDADIVHLGNKGISMFSMNLKKCIVRMAKSHKLSGSRSSPQNIPPRHRKSSSSWNDKTVYNYPIPEPTTNSLSFDNMYMYGKSYHDLNPQFHPHLPPQPPFQPHLPPRPPQISYPSRNLSYGPPPSSQSSSSGLNAPTPGPPPPLPPFPPLPTLPTKVSQSFSGDYRGAVCSSFQLNKQNDGYQN